MKKYLKIAFCALLVASLLYAVFGMHPGKNRLQAQFTEVKNSDILEKIVLDPERNAHLADGFPLSWDAFETEIVRKQNQFYGQRIRLTAVNKNDYPVCIVGLEAVSGNGDENVYLCCLPEREVVIPAETETPHTVWFPVISDLDDNEAVLKAVRNDMEIKIIYADANAVTTEKADLHKEWIRK